ncbi:hypothetical protein ACFSKL_16175 [Belliella marina]|uniref:Uncharacterized protein n=1 Tax=Belliella marina TaxID=1644146 RepID=A0ABW4VSS4_9BACT
MRTLIILFIMLLPFTSKGQIEIDSLSVYKYFEKKGYTTAGVASQFRDFEKKEMELIEMTPIEINQINQILKLAKIKKHRQTKFGISPLFCKAVIGEKKIDFIIGKNIIVDLTNYQNYLIKNEEDRLWLEALIEKIRGD